MCKLSASQQSRHRGTDVKTDSRCILKSRSEVETAGKCFLKSRSEVRRCSSHRCSKKVIIPASVFLAAAEHGLAIAEEGIAKDSAGTLYWNDPWGIREALLYSFRNAIVAAGAYDVKMMKWLEDEARQFSKSERVKVSSAQRLLGVVLEERWARSLDNKEVVYEYERQANRSSELSGSDSCLSYDIRLPDGRRLPRLGFGTAIFSKECDCYTGSQCEACKGMASSLRSAVLAAIKHGYRHFDCAQCYNNEAIIGEALKASRLPRRDFFLASKLSSSDDYGSRATEALVKSQLRKLQTTYLDLYYLHDDIEDTHKEKAAWRALERLHEMGVIKNIGLSNYRTDGIKRVMSFARVRPAVLQIKYDVYHPGYDWGTAEVDDVVQFARKQGMAVVGYANFSGWPSLLRAREDPHITSMAQRYGRTPTQVILRHCLQKGLAVVPASLSEPHIKENALLFDFSLNEADMSYLDCLACLASSERVPWLPHRGAHQNIFRACI